MCIIGNVSSKIRASHTCWRLRKKWNAVCIVCCYIQFTLLCRCLRGIEIISIAWIPQALVHPATWNYHMPSENNDKKDIFTLKSKILVMNMAMDPQVSAIFSHVFDVGLLTARMMLWLYLLTFSCYHYELQSKYSWQVKKLCLHWLC